MNREELLDELEGLPNPDAPDFPPRVALIVTREERIDSLCKDILDSGDLPEHLRFAAFYGALTLYRRGKDVTEFRLTFDRYQRDFATSDTCSAAFLLLESQYYHIVGDRLRNALDLALKAKDALPDDHYVAASHVASVIASLGEKDLDNRVRRRDGQRLREGEVLNDRAIRLEGGRYANYYAIRARLKLLLNEYDDALEAIDDAIDRERSGGPFYSLRIGDYVEIRQRIHFTRSMADLAKRQEQAESAVEKIRDESAQIVALLAAFLALVVAGTQIATSMPFADGARLMIITGGVIVVAFSGFALALGSKGIANKLLALALGGTLLLTGMVLWPLTVVT